LQADKLTAEDRAAMVELARAALAAFLAEPDARDLPDGPAHASESEPAPAPAPAAPPPSTPQR
jgi:hypothetical protein